MLVNTSFLVLGLTLEDRAIAHEAMRLAKACTRFLKPSLAVYQSGEERKRNCFAGAHGPLL
jgi:hypothetical protein